MNSSKQLRKFVAMISRPLVWVDGELTNTNKPIFVIYSSSLFSYVAHTSHSDYTEWEVEGWSIPLVSSNTPLSQVPSLPFEDGCWVILADEKIGPDSEFLFFVVTPERIFSVIPDLPGANNRVIRAFDRGCPPLEMVLDRAFGRAVRPLERQQVRFLNRELCLSKDNAIQLGKLYVVDNVTWERAEGTPRLAPLRPNYDCQWDVARHKRRLIRKVINDEHAKTMALRGFSITQTPEGPYAEKIVMVKSYIKGPKDKPMRQAVRVVREEQVLTE